MTLKFEGVTTHDNSIQEKYNISYITTHSVVKLWPRYMNQAKKISLSEIKF